MSRVLKQINEVLTDYEHAKDNGNMTGLVYEEYAEQLYWALIAASTEIRCLKKTQCECGDDKDVIDHIQSFMQEDE
jgi:hypothetical protein